MANTETDADVLNSIDSTSRNPIPVIYQSGYLTIKEYDSEFGIYKLGFPNLEVEEGFVKLFKIGVNFSSQTRNIERWAVEA